MRHGGRRETTIWEDLDGFRVSYKVLYYKKALSILSNVLEVASLCPGSNQLARCVPRRWLIASCMNRHDSRDNRQ